MIEFVEKYADKKEKKIWNPDTDVCNLVKDASNCRRNKTKKKYYHQTTVKFVDSNKCDFLKDTNRLFRKKTEFLKQAK